MLLAIDVGNTNIIFGVYQDETLVHSWRAHTDRDKTSDEYEVLLSQFFHISGIDARQISGCCLASVVPPLTPTIVNLSRHFLKRDPVVVGPGIRTGVKVRYDNPLEVGADRIVNAVAARARYGGPIIIVDFSTATIFDAISRDGEYMGGAIAPGIGVSVDALVGHTAKLPRIELVMVSRAIGRNTVESMQAGVMLGYVGLVEGLVSRIDAELGGGSKVIATGEWGAVIATQTHIFHAIEQKLTLEGLRLIYNLNT
ncbi:MAG: type III pantothenate kinase [Chloroflexi bacterium]|nr:type III pantothenate kinase [Chloroflexota bacterium]